jgi:hypothetical protein
MHGTDGLWVIGIEEIWEIGGYQLLFVTAVWIIIILAGCFTMRLYDNAAHDYFYFSDWLEWYSR